MIQIRKEDRSLLEAQYLENERQTNRVVVFVSLVFVALCISSEISLKFDFLPVVYAMNRYMFMPLSALIIISLFIARARNYADPWVKYLLFTSVVLLSVGSFFAYTIYMSYLVFLPLFLAARYFNKTFMIQVSVVTFVLYIAACLANLFVLSKSELMQQQYIGYNIWEYPMDAVLYLMLPTTLTFIFVALHSITETVNGRRLLEAKAESVVRNAAVEAELNMASEIQRSSLPDESFVSPNGCFRVAAKEIPAKEVGGDFYDYFMVNDHTLTVLIADVSDKGAPAAMFMMSSKKAIRCAVQCCSSLDSAIRLANALICQDNKSDMFLTLWLAIIDTRSGIGKFINAGHPLPLIRHADGCIDSVCNEPDIFLGGFPDMNPRVNDFRMEKGDILLLCTDGITDAMNYAGESFGNDKLLNSMRLPAPDCGELVESIIADVNRFSDGREQFDDITLLSLQCLSLETPEELSIETDANGKGTAAVIDAIDALLSGQSCPDDKRRSVGVICDEICANISDYAYDGGDGPLRVEAKALSNFITLTFIDSGTAFDPLRQAAPVESDEPVIGGLGIYFIRNLADEISYRREDGRNILTVTVIWDI